LEAAEHNVATARSGHYPTLGLRASYGKAIPGLYDNPSFFGNNDANTSVGLTLSIPIFSGFATQSNVRSSLAQRDIARDQLEQQKRALERNTRNAYQALVAGISEVEARRLALVSRAERVRRLAGRPGSRYPHRARRAEQPAHPVLGAAGLCPVQVQLPAEPACCWNRRPAPWKSPTWKTSTAC
jgi:hypothetical protein